jgi:predicted metal-dependent phosphoesterase TrpH
VSTRVDDLGTMPRFRVDVHVHTTVSPDGLDDPHAVVHAAKLRGLHAIVVTDHDRSGGYRALVAAGIADPDGRAVDGFLVIPGVEVSTVEGHVLVLGGTFETPVSTGPWTAERVAAMARSRGWVSAAAHPLDRCRSGVGVRVLERVRFDAVEVFNSKTLDPRSNARARSFALRHTLPMLGGSDAHHAGAVGRAHTLVYAAELTTEAVLEAVRRRRTTVHEGVHTRREIAQYLRRGMLTRRWMSEWTGRVKGRVKGRWNVQSGRDACTAPFAAAGATPPAAYLTGP